MTFEPSLVTSKVSVSGRRDVAESVQASSVELTAMVRWSLVSVGLAGAGVLRAGSEERRGQQGHEQGLAHRSLRVLSAFSEGRRGQRLTEVVCGA